jgi:hypothetical protein
MKHSMVVALACLLAAAAPARAQDAPVFDPSGFMMQRAELQQMLERYKTFAASEGYSGSQREKARRELAQIEDRLTNGDFRLGDRILLDVQGHPTIPDSLIVENGPKVTIPLMGAIPLGGVLRSELESHLTTELKKYLKEPVVRATSLIRLSIMGSVGKGGFHMAPADMLLTDALMLAGGPAGTADLNKIRIERTGQILWEGEELRTILADGRTLDQLNLRAGDQIMVPALPAGGSRVWQVTKWVVPFVASIVFGFQVFR